MTEHLALTLFVEAHTHFSVPLNLRQQKFAIEYARSGNATHAARAAGYSEHTSTVIGSRLFRNVNVKAAIEAERAKQIAKADEQAEMDARWIKQHVKDIIVENKAELPMVALKGLELASRYNGMFQDGNSIGATAFQINIHLGD